MTVKFNMNYFTIFINDIEIELSQEHYSLLHFISQSKRIVSKEELKQVLKDKWRSDDCLKTAICTINGIIKQHIGKKIIYNKRGIGYYVKKSLVVQEI